MGLPPTTAALRRAGRRTTLNRPGEQARASSTRGALVDVAVVGCGVFGLAAALELRARGHRVVALDQGVVPYPGASSRAVWNPIQPLRGARAHCAARPEGPARGGRPWGARGGGEPF